MAPQQHIQWASVNVEEPEGEASIDVDNKLTIVDDDDKIVLSSLLLAAAVKRMDVTLPRPTERGPSKVLFLNGLRGLAAVLVVLQHAYFMGGLVGGAAGVDVFFVLSSFLLTMLFEKKSRQLLAEGASLRKWACVLADYFSKRFFRVYPLFAIVAVAVWFLPADKKHSVFWVRNPEEYNLFKVLTFSLDSRYHVFWTLPVEIGYYFLIPPFVGMMIALRCLWWVPCIPLFVWIFHDGMYVIRANNMPLNVHVTTFFLGSIGAIMYLKAERAIRHYQFQFKWWQVVPLRVTEWIALAYISSLVFNGLFFHWVMENPLPSAKGPPFVSVPTTFIIVIEMLLPGEIAKCLEWNLLVFCGKISFSMYLWHSFIVFNPIMAHQTYYDRLIGDFLAIFFVSTVSYYVVEYPMQMVAARVGKWLAQRASATQEALK